MNGADTAEAVPSSEKRHGKVLSFAFVDLIMPHYMFHGVPFIKNHSHFFAFSPRRLERSAAQPLKVPSFWQFFTGDY